MKHPSSFNPPTNATHEVAFLRLEVSMTTQPIVADLVARLDDNLREAFEERAGIMEFDGGLAREHAECLALLDLYLWHPLTVLGLCVLRVEAGGYVLARDPASVTAMGLRVLGVADLRQVLAEFDGVARISAIKN